MGFSELFLLEKTNILPAAFGKTRAAKVNQNRKVVGCKTMRKDAKMLCRAE